MIVIDRAVALETGPDGLLAPDLTLRLAALMRDIGRPRRVVSNQVAR